MSDELVLESFENARDQVFRVRDGDAVIELILRDVNPVGTERSRRPDGRKPFSLVFHGQRGLHFPQQIVTMENDTMGELSIFVVPIAPDEHGDSRFEAVFT